VVALGRIALVTAVVLGGARVVQEAVRIVSLA